MNTRPQRGMGFQPMLLPNFRIYAPFVWAFILVALAAAPASAEDPKKDKPPESPELIKDKKPAKEPEEKLPPPLTHYKGREIAQTMHFAGAPWLVRESRDREEDTKTLLKQLNVKPGQLIADLGSGNGFYTLPLAKLTGKDGMVIAVEIQREFLDMLKKRADEQNIKNIELVLGTTVDPKLPENKLDLILLVDVYHELSNPEEVLAAIRKSLKPAGRLALVEFREEDPNVPIKPLHKMSKKQIMKELPANGYKLVEEFDDLPWQHLMFFQRDEEWKAPKK